MRLGQHISGIVIFAALALGASGAARAAETAENPGQVLPINLLPNASLSETASVTASLSESIGGDGTFLQYSLTNNGPIGGSGDGSQSVINGFAVAFALPTIAGQPNLGLNDFQFVLGFPDGTSETIGSPDLVGENDEIILIDENGEIIPAGENGEVILVGENGAIIDLTDPDLEISDEILEFFDLDQVVYFDTKEGIAAGDTLGFFSLGILYEGETQGAILASYFIAQCSGQDNCAHGSTGSVPEPGTLALFGIGLIGLGFMRRRRAA